MSVNVPRNMVSAPLMRCSTRMASPAGMWCATVVGTVVFGRSDCGAGDWPEGLYLNRKWI